MEKFARTLEKDIISRLHSPKAIFILGARQVGKTTLLKRLMEHVGKDNSLYFDIELPRNLELFSDSIDSIIAFLRYSMPTPNGITYVFLDEIQYLKDFSKTVKLFTDHYHEEFKLVMTGSSALMIKHQFRESLVGRKDVFVLYPLSFAEYCLFQGQDKIATELEQGVFSKNSPLLTLRSELNTLLADYAVFGGFPEVAVLSGYEAKSKLLNEIVSSYILKDIRHILKIEKLSELNRLIKNLAYNTGKEVNISELARDVGLHRETLQKYLIGLEESYIISLVRPFHNNFEKEMRKMPKVYFIDTGIRNMLVNNLSPLDQRPDKGELVESIFFANLLRNSHVTTRIMYWKTKNAGEVDFVVSEDGRINAFEVKYGADTKNHFRSFLNLYPKATCKMVRYLYEYAEDELPLWWIQ